MSMPPAIHAWETRWDALALRERVLVAAAALLVSLSVLWWVALAPALHVLRAAPAQHQALDDELSRMRALAQRARELQGQTRPSYDETLRALESAVRQRLGPAAVLSVVGDRATVTVKGASGEALAQWLAQVRINARAVPLEARLQRTPAASGLPGWDGTLLLSLPAR